MGRTCRPDAGDIGQASKLHLKGLHFILLIRLTLGAFLLVFFGLLLFPLKLLPLLSGQFGTLL